MNVFPNLKKFSYSFFRDSYSIRLEKTILKNSKLLVVSSFIIDEHSHFYSYFIFLLKVFWQFRQRKDLWSLSKLLMLLLTFLLFWFILNHSRFQFFNRTNFSKFENISSYEFCQQSNYLQKTQFSFVYYYFQNLSNHLKRNSRVQYLTN